VPEIAARAMADPSEEAAGAVINDAILALAQALRHVMNLLCPKRIVIGGGVSLMGELLFGMLRWFHVQHPFEPFRGLTDIVPAALGEEVVVHGAIALARQADRA
jgi:glucokinase